jgi:hypothetical protein
MGCGPVKDGLGRVARSRDDGPALTPHFPASGFGRGIRCWWSLTKLAYTVGNCDKAATLRIQRRTHRRRHSLDRNSRIGIAMYIVAEIFDRRRSTSGNNFIMVSLMSTMQIVNELIDWREQRGSVPVLRVRVLIRSCWWCWSRLLP